MLLCLLWNATWAAPNVFLTTFIFLFFYSSSSWIVPTQGTVGVTLENEANAFETEVGNAEVEEETATAMASSAASVSEWVKVKDDDSGADYFIEKRAQNSTQGRRSSWVLPEGGVHVAASSSESDASSSEDDEPVEQTTEAKLPPNWLSHVDQEGRLYYNNSVTDETIWTFPTE